MLGFPQLEEDQHAEEMLFRGNARLGFGVSTSQSMIVGLLGAIYTGSLRIAVPVFQQGLALIALLQGKLYVISHECSSSLPIKEARMLTQLVP